MYEGGSRRWLPLAPYYHTPFMACRIRGIRRSSPKWKFAIKATLVLGGLWLAWKILSVVAAVVGLALLLWIVFGK